MEVTPLKRALHLLILWMLVLVFVGCTLVSRPQVKVDAGHDFSTIVGREVLFDGTKSVVGQAKSLKYHWEINGETLVGQQVSYVFTEPGEYQVQFVLTVDGVEFTDKIRVFVADTNLLNNGDFSQINPDTGIPVGWEPQAFSTEGEAFVVRDADDAYIGRNYVGITVTKTQDRAQWSQRKDNLEPGMYRVAGRYRIDTPIGQQNRVHVRLLRMTKEWEKIFPDTYFYLQQDTGGEWFYFEQDFEITEEVEVTFLEFQLFHAIGTVYYDDLMLMKLP